MKTGALIEVPWVVQNNPSEELHGIDIQIQKAMRPFT